MNKQNNNNLFNKDELLKLLNDKQSGDKKSFADLDDFEKEALQGFESLEDTTKATQLLNDIDKKISTRVGEGSVSKRKPYLWIGAAASIALIILISVFVVKQSHKELATTNIALNEPENNLDKTIVIESLPTIINSDAAIVPNEKNSVQKDNLKQNETATVSDQIAKKRNTVSTREPQILDAEKKEYNYKADELANDADIKTLVGSSNSNDLTLGEQVVTTATDETKPVSSAPVVSKESGLDNVAFNKSKNKYDDKKTSGYNEERLALEKSAKAKSNPEAMKATADNAPTAGASLVSDTKAFYFGGNVKLKQDVINYNAAKNDNRPMLVGDYKIVMTVYDSGLIKVKNITALSGNCNTCSDVISKALFSFKIWEPATVKGKFVTSDLEIKLSF